MLFIVGLKHGVRADVEAGFCGQGLHFGYIADEGGLDEAFDGGFDGAAQGNVRERPYDGGGEGGEIFAALDELVEDVEVGRMVNEGVEGNGFSKRG
jgi:hypothetical protein